MAHDWDAHAEGWESDASVKEYADLAYNELEKITAFTGKRVFDFGCGTGLLTEKLSPLVKDIVALDASEAMIEELDKKLLENVEPVVDYLSRGLIAQHPAFRGQFDIVVASSVCGFIDDYETAAELIYSLLEDKGVFVHWDWLSDDADGLSEKRIEKTLLKAGFDSVTVSVPFEIATKQGTYAVVMGVGVK